MTVRCYKGFLFDLDGTLIDTAELIAESFRHASREMLGKALPDDVLLANVGQPLMAQMEVLGGDRAREWYDTYREFNHARHDEFIMPYPGIEELLEELRRRGAAMAIVTSKSRETVDMAFRCIPIEDYFVSVITADDTDFHKPSPHPLQLALRQLDLTPDEAVYIGDSPFDLKAGQAAGTATAAVGWGIFPPVRLKELEPDFYFERPDEILKLCQRSRKHMVNKGKVYLIGAGPGDPGLFTLKGVECLRRADVVVYDYLAGKQLLEYAPPEAERIYVGKKGGEHTMEQDDINQLLVDKGLEGKVVARLKGGDSFIFGRGGEEALALKAAGVPFEIVPGISSAYSVPAYAGIPVTHRGLTTDVAFITGHEDPTKSGSTIKWDKISTGIGTLVFLMGVKNLPYIVEQLTANGRPADTPIALVRWGTTARQETLTGTLADIVGKVRETGFKAPAITIVGEVVSLREQLSWFEDRPLFGKRVVVTRSRSQASDLVAELEALGAVPVEFPTIKVAPPADGFAALDRAVEGIRSAQAPAWDWLLFTSVNGVEKFFERLDLAGDVRDLRGIRLGAIGPATAAALARRGLKIDFVPVEYRAESVVEGLLELGVKGSRVLIPRAKEAREVLPEQLKQAGAEVEVVTAYETMLDDSDAAGMKDMLMAGEIDIITFTSSSTVKNFAALLNGIDLSQLPAKTVIACIGPVTADTVRELGLKVDVMAEEYTIPGLVKALAGVTANH